MLKRTSILNEPNEISYFEDIFKLQEKYQRDLIEGNSEFQFIWIGEHNLCYTIGRGSNKNNLLNLLEVSPQNIFTINRGGEVTCHMPGQLVIYLILDLRNYRKDLDWYLRKLEDIVINILSHFNIKSSTKAGFTGVWCNNKKIASIGIGCKRWITLHGFSINVDCDLDNFNHIIPCGIKDCEMTRISDLERNIRIADVRKIVKKIIQKEFNMKFVSK